jgi:hypothetical protein
MFSQLFLLRKRSELVRFTIDHDDFRAPLNTPGPGYFSPSAPPLAGLALIAIYKLSFVDLWTIY